MSGDTPSGLFDRPVLAIDPGVHRGAILSSDVDAAGNLAVTGSDDRTVRIWNLADGSLKRTIRVPQGPGNVGKIHAVAISPDGELVAAGGWTRLSGDQPSEQIYVFSVVNGMLRHRIDGLPSGASALMFSPEGLRLAATLSNGLGLRLWRLDQDWSETRCAAWFMGHCANVTFAPDGRLATSCDDGKIRLYDPDGRFVESAPSGAVRPYGLAFAPDGARLAIGDAASSVVRLLDGHRLAPLPGPNVDGLGDEDLSVVAWSMDGTTLHAAGASHDAGVRMILAWGPDGSRRRLPIGTDRVTGLQALPGGDLLVATCDPRLERLGPDGAPRWVRTRRQADFRNQFANLAVSVDATVIDFGLKFGGEDRVRYNVSELDAPVRDPPDDGTTAPPVQHGLDILDWINGNPLLDGAVIPLELRDRSRGLAIHPDGKRFLIGTNWWLKFFDREHAEIWGRPVPSVVWAVNISGDGRLAIAACGDGTIRWHRIEDGVEILALFPLPDRENWVAWTPEGIYAATPDARGVLRWHVNRGWDRAAEAIPVSEIPETNRPEVIRHVLSQMGTAGALAVTEMAKIRGAVRRATGSDVAPGARLHVLAIGISDYGEAARHLDLAYADHDARDVAAALRSSQGGLYAEVRATALVNAEATKARIFAGLEEIRAGMEAGGGADLAVIQFSGHGDMVDGGFYLLPHGIDDGSSAAVKANGLPATQFHDEIAAIAPHGRVLLLIDACRSGGATAPPDRSLRAMMRSANVTVLTSCAEKQLSREDMAWENGAFTEALLEALGGADYDHDGLIGIGDLCRYLGERVPAMTDGAQRPEVETRGSDIRILARL